MRDAALILLLTLAGLGSVSTVAAAQEQKGMKVERAWARASIGTSRPAAAYLTIVNSGSQVARLVGITTPIAGHAVVHRTIKEGDIMRMTPAGEISVPADAEVVFAPGGLHVMLMELKQPLDRGGTFPLTLQFADGGTIDVMMPILGPGARGPNE